MKRYLLTLLVLLCVLPVALNALQETQPELLLEITGVNATQLPTVTITANVYDALGQPVGGLTADNFTLFGELETSAEIVSVENITDDSLPFATVLVIDTSDSMSGVPLARAQEAARTFVNSIGENDLVAMVAFSSTIRIVQDFTTDKSVLLTSIDALRFGGPTPLYQGAFEGIELAAMSPTPRRAMILLSDGAEYGGLSTVARDDVSQQARARGVPVYTIGLGYGTDRTFLEGLSQATNARFYESPAPEQLVQLYADLAALLRSQYVITLSADLPFDGSEYDFGIEIASGEGSAAANAVLRAPIPVPIVQLSGLPAAPLEEPIDVTADVQADDQITGVTFTAGDQTVTLTDEPYTFTIDPAAFLPGDYTLTAAVEDANGDVGSADTTFTVAALPSEVTISPDLTTLGEIDEEISVNVSVSGQTPPTTIQYSLLGPAFPEGELLPLGGAGNTIVVQPQSLVAGDNLLTLQVTNAGGVTSTMAISFRVASLPPVITVGGIQDGQIIDTPVSFEVSAFGQTPAINIAASVGGQAIEPERTETIDNVVRSSFSLDPIQFEPGARTVTITASDENNESGSETINIIISPLPPTIVASGLEDGDVLTEDQTVDLEFVSQTPLTRVTWLIDGEDLDQQVSAPFSTTVSVLEFAPGEHTLSVVANNASNQSSTLDINFTVAEGPSLTATALVPTPTGIPSATPDVGATNTEQAALAAARTGTAEALSANMTGTAERVALETQVFVAEATMNAGATADARTATSAQATQIAQMTASAEIRASGTLAARATSQAAAQQEALQSTRAGLATANMQARVNATETSDARTTRNAIVTRTEVANATASALAATETADARATRLAGSNQTATQLARLLATETAAGAGTATRSALETQVANSQATLDAQSTRDAQETRNAEATERFNQTATAIEQATLDTHLAAVGLTATPTGSHTPEENEITAVAQALETGTPRPSPTPQPTLTLIEAENPPTQGDIVPVAIIGIVLLILLVIVYLILASRRRQRQR